MIFDIQEELKKLPAKPGVYIMHDAHDVIIYVGKAIILKNRVRSYFRTSTKKTPKIQDMVRHIAWFEYIVTDSEVEALVLENNLIKENLPKYNTMLKDDKTYPYIKVTVQEDFPRVMMSRELKKDHAKYFGPYMSAQSVHETVDLINSLFSLRTCSRKLPETIGKERSCLNEHIHRCSAPCTGAVSCAEYHKQVEGAIRFLQGEYTEILRELNSKMMDASERMEFEDAARYRDLIRSVGMIAEHQKITDAGQEDKDIIAIARGEGDSVIQVFFVRAGRMIGREHFYMTRTEGEASADILSEFLKQFYSGTPFIPRFLMLQEEIPDADVISEWLSRVKGQKVSITVPQKGQKEKLMELAVRNAELQLEKDGNKLRREEERTTGAQEDIRNLLGLTQLSRMEAFDISNTGGFANVASMVVFENGSPKRSDYRKFKIKTVAGPDDYACMREVMTRRLERFGDETFARIPDLFLMDGGKGQVHAALEIMEKFDIHVPVCGMVKDDNHRTRAVFFNEQELPIDTGSEAFKLITRIQDEAHRFAIEYHRSLRQQNQVHSVLDEVPGIGPKRRRALMRAFQSIDEVLAADVDTLASIEGFNRPAAEAVYAYFHKEPEL